MHHHHQPETQPLQQTGPQQQSAGGAEQFESDYGIQHAGQHGQSTTQHGQGMAQEGQFAAQESYGMEQQMGMRLQDVETPQQRVAVDNITRAIQVCEWCADQCIQLADPSMIECIRHCRDVAELGQQALVLIPRNSPHAETALQMLKRAARTCGQECSRHPHGHCQECAQVLDETVRSIEEMIGMTGQQGGQMAEPVGSQQGGQMAEPVGPQHGGMQQIGPQ